jgi:hypothetical protein
MKTDIELQHDVQNELKWEPAWRPLTSAWQRKAVS